MARIARIVVPGLPHHVTQRGNRRQPTFFSDDDYALYLALMAASCRQHGVQVWAYCLMPNHVHLMAIPATTDGLHRGIGGAHRRYSRHVNARQGWCGYLWQGRFASFPLDDPHVAAAARYIELNPVRARLVDRPADWRWSSATAHLAGRDDGLCRAAPLLEMIGDWRTFLTLAPGDDDLATIHRHERTGRPLGDDGFVERLEARLGRILRRRKPGPKRAETSASAR